MKLIRKLLFIIFLLALAVILVSPAWYLYTHPEMLIVPTPLSVSAEGDLEFPKATPVAPNFILAISKDTPTPVSTGGEAVSVVVTAETVNLRLLSDGTATGYYLSRGDVVTVLWKESGYGRIIAPTQYVGFIVWRGCTSDAAGLGCEAK